MPTTWTEAAEEELKADSKLFRELSSEHLLTAVFIKYFLRDGDLTSSDFRACFTDGPNDGGIDAVSVYEQDDLARIALVQSKRVNRIDKDDVLAIVHKITATLSDYSSGGAARYSNKLRAAYEGAIGSTDSAPRDILVCTTATPSNNIKDKISTAIRNDTKLSDYNVEVFFGDEIEDTIESVDQPREHVEEDSVIRDTNSSALKYTLPDQDLPKGMFINVYASSINKLYSKYNDQGLFAQNLRQFIPNKKVDDGISDTIAKDPSSFWLKNNGLTFACSGFRNDGNRVVLYNFSIINGCQTATKIGKSIIPQDDFLVPCKIICESEKKRMAEFAEAANSQKPIQDRDLRANAKEQIQLKREFQNQTPPVYLSIKRGVRQFTKAQRTNRGIRHWQQLDNKLYGQLVLAFHLQKPEVAFAHAGRIFSSNDTYKDVFLRRKNLTTEIDIFRLHDSFIQWRDGFLDNEHVSEIDQAIVNQGRFSIIATCALLIKAKRKLVDTKLCNHKDDWIREIVRKNLTGQLLNAPHRDVDLPAETDKRLQDLFRLILEVHQGCVEESDNIARLYKSDSFYLQSLTPRLISRMDNSLFKQLLEDAMKAFK